MFKDLETDLRLYYNLSHILHSTIVVSVDITEPMSVCGARAVDGFMEIRQKALCRAAGVCIPMTLLLQSVLFSFSFSILNF